MQQRNGEKELKAQMRELALRHPRYGYRRIAALLERDGWHVNKKRVLRLWRHGRALEAVVMESRQTALAPRSRFVRCAPVEQGDKRVFGVYVPDRAGRASEGDAVWLLADPAGKRDAVSLPWLM